MHPVQVVLAVLAMALGAWIQGAVGFGSALIAAPLLALIDTDLVPGPVTIAGLTLNVLLMRRDRPAGGDRQIGWAIVGLVPGTAAAGATLALLSARGLSVAFAILVIVAVALTASGLAVARNRHTLLAAGIVSGYMSTIAAIGGPPVALLYQHDTAALLRATLPRYFFVSGVLALVALVPAGKLGGAELLEGVALIPGVLVGFAGSGWLARHLDRRSARPVVLGLSALAAIVVLVRSLV